MAILDELIAHPGLYVGLDVDPDSAHHGAARIIVTRLPGGSGVTLDYEVFNPAVPDRLRPHHEHTVIARTHDGATIMVIGHTHADTVAVLRETAPGTFELGAEGSPFPMKVVLSSTGEGKFRHAWWYGRPGEELVERDATEVALVP